MKFQSTFNELYERNEDLKSMLKYDDEYYNLSKAEKSEIENMIGLCEDVVVRSQEVLEKYCPQYRKVHGIRGIGF